MDAKELANMINGREYRYETTEEIIRLAKENGLIIVTGYSDDCVEFMGLMDDEIGVYNGGIFLIIKPGDFYPYPDNTGSYRKADHLEAIWLDEEIERNVFKNKIEARWCPDREDGLEPSFDYKTTIPHETFNIYEGDELYCIGMVIDVKNLE